jgi:hypothetical protein
MSSFGRAFRLVLGQRVKGMCGDFLFCATAVKGSFPFLAELGLLHWSSTVPFTSR